LEIGSEATPAAFLSTLLALTREWRRVLAPHGSICVELGDTYSGAGGDNHLYDTGYSGHHTYPVVKQPKGAGRARNVSAGWPLDKSLCLLPTLYPASLAYGWNMLNPTDRIDPMRIRNVVVWHRPNPPVGALGDKVRPSTSYVTIACTRRDRWFDLDAERGPSVNPIGVGVRPTQARVNGSDNNDSRSTLGPYTAEMQSAGAPPLDYWQLDEDPADADAPAHQAWTIPTQPYAGSHYATFPIALPRRLIRLMCPMHVCRECGEPRRRIVGEAEYAKPDGRPHAFHGDGFETNASGANRRKVTGADNGNMARQAPTLGWSDCGHNTWRRGKVLDPFAGSGTTLAAATEQGRDAIGIDLDERNLWLARERVGLFLEAV
jgi:DNA methylase